MDETCAQTAGVTPLQESSYRSLPHKGQLFVLLLARLAEPLISSSIQSYMFFQLRHFDPSESPSAIATQFGLIISSKTAAHVCTGLLWGRLADHKHIGRKPVLLIGILASSLATLGYGFSRNFKEAITWQVLDGALNSTIAMVRCMVSELNPEKRHRARALTLLPLFANIGSLLGPLIGGFLAAARSSSTFMSRYPYAAPNVCVASIEALLGVCIAFSLSETLEGYIAPIHRDSANKSPDERDRTPDSTHSSSPHSLSRNTGETSPLIRPNAPNTTPPRAYSSLSFRRMWTRNVLSTMLAQFIIAGHLGTFASLWAIFLSTPAEPKRTQHPPLSFSGGLGMEPQSVGTALSLIGFAGIVLQIIIYPPLQDRFGTIKLWRASLCIFPVVYILAPYCALFASLGIEENKGGKNAMKSSLPAVWAALLVILVLFVAGRTCVVPATSLLINDCTPHPSVRGTVHTTGVIASNLSRSIFPTAALLVFGFGLKIGAVGLGFWFLAGLALLSCLASCWVEEGSNGGQTA